MNFIPIKWTINNILMYARLGLSFVALLLCVVQVLYTVNDWGDKITPISL